MSPPMVQPTEFEFVGVKFIEESEMKMEELGSKITAVNTEDGVCFIPYEDEKYLLSSVEIICRFVREETENDNRINSNN